MNFTPKTEEQIAAEGMLPEGIYPFEVLNAVDTKSKTSGDEMIKIQIRVFTEDGRDATLTDYLLASYLRKILNFCKVTGLSAKYNAGTLCAEDCLAKNGYARIGIEKGKEKSQKPGEFFDDKNTVKDYITAPVTSTVSAKPQPNDAQLQNKSAENDEDVPF